MGKKLSQAEIKRLEDKIKDAVDGGDWYGMAYAVAKFLAKVRETQGMPLSKDWRIQEMIDNAD